MRSRLLRRPPSPNGVPLNWPDCGSTYESNRVIPYGKQSICEADIQAVMKVLQSDFLTLGPMLGEFESKLSAYCQVEHAVACNSGTAALHMAYAALGIKDGDVVVVPANTFLATANAAIFLGAEVRFCDVDPLTGLMTPQTLAEVLDDQVSLVVPVHFAGMPCQMREIAELVREVCPNARIVEDASHAIGGVHTDGSPVGSLKWADMATFSFHPVKQIAAGEGGAVTTNCAKLREKLDAFRCHGMTKNQNVMLRPDEGPWYYEMHDVGFNYRIPEASCALASSQMDRLNQFVTRRRQIATMYFDRISDLPGVQVPPREQLNASAWHLFCLHIDFDQLGMDRIAMMEALKQRGVGTQVHYYPVVGQPFYRNRYGWDESKFVGAIKHYQSELSVPMFPSMTDAEVNTVVDAVTEISTIAVNSSTRRVA